MVAGQESHVCCGGIGWGEWEAAVKAEQVSCILLKGVGWEDGKGGGGWAVESRMLGGGRREGGKQFLWLGR